MRTFDAAILKISGRINQSLPDILVIELRILAAEFVTIGVVGHQLDDSSNR
jgi:hypothetical protein